MIFSFKYSFWISIFITNYTLFFSFHTIKWRSIINYFLFYCLCSLFQYILNMFACINIFSFYANSNRRHKFNDIHNIRIQKAFLPLTLEASTNNIYIFPLKICSSFSWNKLVYQVQVRRKISCEVTFNHSGFSLIWYLSLKLWTHF